MIKVRHSFQISCPVQNHEVLYPSASLIVKYTSRYCFVVWDSFCFYGTLRPHVLQQYIHGLCIWPQKDATAAGNPAYLI